MSKKANNILDFLIDPTKIPVKDRVYFGPEEILQNAIYEKAKAEAYAAFKDQKNNSDFYPHKKSSLTQEANIMDRKSLIASLDVLSRNFKEASDPIAADLRNMAVALSKMDDETLQARLASDAPDFEEVLSANTFKCPDCGTNVLEQTKYCVKCKKKVQPKTAKEEVEKEEMAEEKDAMLVTPTRDFGNRMDKGTANPSGKIKSDAEITKLFNENKAEIEKTPWLKKLFDGLAGVHTAEEKEAAGVISPLDREVGQRFPGSSAMPGGVKINSVYNENKAEIEKTPWLKKLFDGLMSKHASEDFWTKEASDIVARALVAEIIGVVAEKEEVKEVAEKEEVKEVAESKEAGKIKGPGKPDGSGPMSDTSLCPLKKEEKEAAKVEEPVVEEKKDCKVAKEEKVEEKVEEKMEEPKEAVVNTDVLASYTYAGIEVPMNFIDEAGDMSVTEKENLARLF